MLVLVGLLVDAGVISDYIIVEVYCLTDGIALSSFSDRQCLGVVFMVRWIVHQTLPSSVVVIELF